MSKRTKALRNNLESSNVVIAEITKRASLNEEESREFLDIFRNSAIAKAAITDRSRLEETAVAQREAIKAEALEKLDSIFQEARHQEQIIANKNELEKIAIAEKDEIKGEYFREFDSNIFQYALELHKKDGAKLLDATIKSLKFKVKELLKPQEANNSATHSIKDKYIKEFEENITALEVLQREEVFNNPKTIEEVDKLRIEVYFKEYEPCADLAFLYSTIISKIPSIKGVHELAAPKWSDPSTTGLQDFYTAFEDYLTARNEMFSKVCYVLQKSARELIHEGVDNFDAHFTSLMQPSEPTECPVLAGDVPTPAEDNA